MARLSRSSSSSGPSPAPRRADGEAPAATPDLGLLEPRELQEIRRRARARPRSAGLAPLMPLMAPAPLPPGAPAQPLFGDLSVEPEEARSILRPQRDERHGFGYTFSPYRGCGHGCSYCYMREYPHPVHGPGSWGRWSAPKLNAPELLWRERGRLHGHGVFLGTATDPYQPLEREYGLTRRCLEVLLECPTTRVLLHTRSALVLRDLDLLKAFGPRLRVGFSIPTDDDTVRQVVEPAAPAIPVRWGAVERLGAAGVAVCVAVCPLMPVQDPVRMGRRLRDSGARDVWVGSLRLLKDDPFAQLLEERGWTRILDPAYVQGVRQELEGALEAARKGEGAAPLSPFEAALPPAAVAPAVLRAAGRKACRPVLPGPPQPLPRALFEGI